MENHLVSIALCTFNGGKYLEAQLDSILSQEYSPLEIIAVDDNSTDDTKKILNDYRERHGNIHIHFNTTTLGYNKNFEKALSICNGRYISISDQDDIWHKDKIEKLVMNIGDNWAICSNSTFMDVSGNALDGRLIQHLGRLDHFENILMENFFTGHTSLISRDILPYIFPIPENGFYDWWIGFVALYHNKLNYLDESLTKHRLHNGSVIQQKKEHRQAKKNLAEVIIQLGMFLEYKNLTQTDKTLLANIKLRLEDSKGHHINWLLFYLLKNYSRLFPKRKHKALISKVNFLRKFLKN